MENNSNPWHFVVIFLVCLGIYFVLPDRMVNGVSKCDYEKIVENYDSLKIHYNLYKSSGRKAGYITPAEIDDLREIFIFLHAEAVQEVHCKYRIPASVCMAQAIIESDAGTSRLTDTTGNYFGIKCMVHSTSSCLDKEYKDCCVQYHDDEKYDHFKKYVDVSESFLDYAIKVTNSDRYNDCFQCGANYKCWARRLQKSGYATNGQYAEMLIGMIEMYKLQKLDTTKPYRLTPKQIKRLTGTKKK